MNDELKLFFAQKGIAHEPLPPYTPEFNGVAERFNHTLQEMVRPWIIKLNKKYWAEAYASAVYTKNRMPHSSVKGMCHGHEGTNYMTRPGRVI